MTTTIYLVRHGEVHNPEQIIYGRLPGFGLSTKGREQVEAAATALEKLKPFDVLYSSPLQRAQESAALLTARLQMPILEDELLAETEIGGYQGKSFDALPKPYLTEEGVAGIEGASSMRARFLAWATEVQQQGCRIVAVSHRDPIGVALLHWQGQDLSQLPGMDLPTASVHEVALTAERGRVTRCWPPVSEEG